AMTGSTSRVHGGARVTDSDLFAVPDLADAVAHASRATPRSVPKFRLPVGEAFDAARRRGAAREPWTPPRAMVPPRRARVRPRRRHTLAPMPRWDDDPSTCSRAAAHRPDTTVPMARRDANVSARPL